MSRQRYEFYQPGGGRAHAGEACQKCYGTVQHAGFGLGFERTLAYVTGLSNVRDAIPFPRTPGNTRY